MGGLFYVIGRIITLGNPKAKARINRVCEEKVLKTIENAVVCAGAAATGTILLAASTSTITTSTVISGIAGASHTAKTGKRGLVIRYVESPRKKDKPNDYVPVQPPVKITKIQQDELEKNASIYRGRIFVFNDDVENFNVAINNAYCSLPWNVNHSTDAIDRQSNFVFLNLPQQTAAEHIQNAWFNYRNPRFEERTSVLDTVLERTGVSVTYEDGRRIIDISSDADPKICEILELPSPTLGDKRNVLELHDKAVEKVTMTQFDMNSSAVSLATSKSIADASMNAASLIWSTYQHYRARKEVSRHDPDFENKTNVTYPELLNP